MQRRDTPAARAALARRRQRAAAFLSRTMNSNNNTAETSKNSIQRKLPPSSSTSVSASSPNKKSDDNPVLSTASPVVRKVVSNHRNSPSQPQKQPQSPATANTHRAALLFSKHHHHHPSASTPKHHSQNQNIHQNHHHSSSQQTVDGTLTTAALTTTTAGHSTAAAAPPSSLVVPSNPQTATETTTRIIPKRAASPRVQRATHIVSKHRSSFQTHNNTATGASPSSHSQQEEGVTSPARRRLNELSQQQRATANLSSPPRSAASSSLAQRAAAASHRLSSSPRPTQTAEAAAAASPRQQRSNAFSSSSHLPPTSTMGRPLASPSSSSRRVMTSAASASSPRQHKSAYHHTPFDHHSSSSPQHRAGSPFRSSSPVDKFYEQEEEEEQQSSPPRRQQPQSSSYYKNHQHRPPPLQIHNNDDPSFHHQDATTTNLNHPYATASSSPGVERLSSMLVETSSVAEIATLPSQPQYHTTPTKALSSPSRRQQQHPPRPIQSEEQQEEERAVSKQSLPQPVDAACLKTASYVMLRSYAAAATLQVQPMSDNNDLMTVTPSGLGLGTHTEVLKITKVVSDHDGAADETLRYGDTVVFHSTTTSTAKHHHCLGVRKVSGAEGSSLTMGFFSSSIGPAEKWRLMEARPDRPVLVGRRAAAAVSSSSTRTKHESRRPIRSGDGILLCNCQTGGILSVVSNHPSTQSGASSSSLILLTDSYGRSSGAVQNHSAAAAGNTGASSSTSLLGQLQHHDQLYPEASDTFQLLSWTTPTCPVWVSPGLEIKQDERKFLSGSYLFDDSREINDAYEHNDVNGSRSNPTDAQLSSRDKEAILMEEVIGSFFGLEGRHIRLLKATATTTTSNIHQSTGSFTTTNNKTSLDHYFEFQLVNAHGVSFDSGLRNLVEQILPLSTSFVRVRHFVTSHYPGYEYGRVMQALCEGLDGILQDYLRFMARIEQDFRASQLEQSSSSSLTMKSIYFQITPSLHSMSILEHATKAVYEKKGGALINALRSLDSRVYMGDTVAKKVLGILMEHATAPYMAMLTTWLQSGVLNDPFEEFMVQRNNHQGTARKHNNVTAAAAVLDGDAWAKLFVLRDEHALDGIVSADWTKQKVLTTGKYWNAVQACQVHQFGTSQDNNSSSIGNHPRDLPGLAFGSTAPAVASYIGSMYEEASRALVRLLMDKFQLMESLQLIRRYFLIDQGDFLMHFLDAAEGELLKEYHDISAGRVQHLLSMSIQVTESYREETDFGSVIHGDNGLSFHLTPRALRCRFSRESLIAHLDKMHSGGIADNAPRTPSRHAYGGGSHNKELTGIEAFSLDLPQIPFPVSLVLSPHTMDSYKLLFRHIFFAKHVERRLIGVWKDHQALKGLDAIRGLMGPTFLLRQRMLHFLQNLIYYMTYEVIDNNWNELQASIDDPTGRDDDKSEMMSRSPRNKEQTVDDILDIHNNFLQRTLEACLLTNRDLLRSLTKLMKTCLLFSDQMKRFIETTKIHDDGDRNAAEKRVAVQRNLNERSAGRPVNKEALRKTLVANKEKREGQIIQQTQRVGREIASDSYKRMVTRFDEVFNADLADFMVHLNSHTATGIMANLGIRLDYNGYITSSVVRRSRS